MKNTTAANKEEEEDYHHHHHHPNNDDNDDDEDHDAVDVDDESEEPPKPVSSSGSSSSSDNSNDEKDGDNKNETSSSSSSSSSGGDNTEDDAEDDDDDGSKRKSSQQQQHLKDQSSSSSFLQQQTQQQQEEEGRSVGGSSSAGGVSTTTTTTTTTTTGVGCSRFFAPYRTIGLLTSNAMNPFHLIPNQDSSTAMLCTVIGDRFHIIRTDKLQPILVGQTVPTTTTTTTVVVPNQTTTTNQHQQHHVRMGVDDNDNNNNDDDKKKMMMKMKNSTTNRAVKGLHTKQQQQQYWWGTNPTSSTNRQEISHILGDSTLRITLVAHGPTGTGVGGGLLNNIYNNKSSSCCSCFLTLYNRTKPIVSKNVVLDVPVARTVDNNNNNNNMMSLLSSWKIVELMHLGLMMASTTARMDDEKFGTRENHAIIGVVLQRVQQRQRRQQQQQQTKRTKRRRDTRRKRKKKYDDDDDSRDDDDDDDEDGGVPVVCDYHDNSSSSSSSNDDHDDDEDDDDDDDDSSSSSDGDNNFDNSHTTTTQHQQQQQEQQQQQQQTLGGCMVLYLAGRKTLRFYKHISFEKKKNDNKRLNNFCPNKAIHPATYVNKIVIGGSSSDSDSDSSSTTTSQQQSQSKQEQQPAMVLLNIRTCKVIHRFQCLSLFHRNHYNNNNKTITTTTKMTTRSQRQQCCSNITAMEQSPAIDTIAVGTNRGCVHLINLKHDTILFTLLHTTTTTSTTTNHHHNNNMISITSMSFRNDGTAMKYNIAPLAVGRDDGTITIWDLSPPNTDTDDDSSSSSSDDDYDDNKDTKRRNPPPPVVVSRKILCELKHIHPGGVSKVQYLPQEPLLVSTGYKSNSIIIHIFDNPDHSGRILRQRRGHTCPPTLIRYRFPGCGGGGGTGNGGSTLANVMDGTDASSCQIVSASSGDRTIRMFSTARSVLDRELSQGRGLYKKAKKYGLIGRNNNHNNNNNNSNDNGISELLLPPVLDIATCDTRNRDWGDMVTIHTNHSFAYVWNVTKHYSQCGPVLKQPTWNVSKMKIKPPKHTHATSVAMSLCGNFVVVGTFGGIIYKYNVQSGIAYGTYPKNTTMEDDDDNNINKKNKSGGMIGSVKRAMNILEKESQGATRIANLDRSMINDEQRIRKQQKQRERLRYASHTGYAVTGLAIESVNKTMISVGDDCKLIIWNFQKHLPIHNNNNNNNKSSKDVPPYILPSPAMKLRYIHENELAAIALRDYSIILFDCITSNIVRRFGMCPNHNNIHTGISKNNILSTTTTTTTPNHAHYHLGPITDLCFSIDGRQMYTASQDYTVRVWDVMSNKCIDWLQFSNVPTSLTISPTGEYIAITIQNSIPIRIYSNRSYYCNTTAMLMNNDTTNRLLTRPYIMDEPTTTIFDGISNYVNNNNNNNNNDTTAEAAVTKSTSNNSKKDNNVQEEKNKKKNFIVVPKCSGIITLSGLPTSHWKNLFHLELIKERNRPKEAPKKPPSAPFFLQWRDAELNKKNSEHEDNNNNNNFDSTTTTTTKSKIKIHKQHGDDDILVNDNEEDAEWAAAWSDDDDDKDKSNSNSNAIGDEDSGKKRILEKGALAHPAEESSNCRKRRKVTHYRSRLATILMECATSKRQQQRQRPHLEEEEAEKDNDDDKDEEVNAESVVAVVDDDDDDAGISSNSNTNTNSSSRRDRRYYASVTDYIITLGPSAIDVELSSLCNGTHDFDAGIPLLIYACEWLYEEFRSRERYDVMNAYLHRFLSLHATIIAGIDDDDNNMEEDFEGTTNDKSHRNNTITIRRKHEERKTKDRMELLNAAVARLRRCQRDAANAFRGKMQHALCLLSHFSRMV